MKKYFRISILVLTSVMLITSCGKKKKGGEEVVSTPWDYITVVETQRGLLYNYTANWCQPCGNWGVPLVNNSLALGDVVALVIKATGDPQADSLMYTDHVAERTTGGGIPSFWVGDETSSANNTISKLNTLKASTPTVALGAKDSISGDNMLVYTTIKTLSSFDATQTYKVAVLVQEDGLKYTQAGITDTEYKHKCVVRCAYNDKVYGTTTTLTANTEHKLEFSIPLKSTWVKENLYATVIVYKEGTGTPASKFVNCVWTRP